MCDKRDDFDFEIVNFPFIDGDVPRSTSYESIYLNSFVLLEHLAMLLTSTLAINCQLRNFFKQGYQYHKLRTTYSKFYRRYYNLIFKFQIGLKSLLSQGLLEQEF